MSVTVAAFGALAGLGGVVGTGSSAAGQYQYGDEDDCDDVEGAGTLSTNPKAFFAIDVEARGTAPVLGYVAYFDRARSLTFWPTRIDVLTITGASALISGVGRANGAVVQFRVDVSDGRPDTFAIQLSNGYTAAGTVRPFGNDADGGIVISHECPPDDDDEDDDEDDDDEDDD